MIISNNITTYSFLTILINVGKRSFENMGRLIKKSGDIISRMLRPGDKSLEASRKIAQQIFAKKRTLVIARWRWGIEKMHRTTKQSMGLQECFSTKIDTQFNHIC